MSIERRTVIKGGAATTLAAVVGGPFQGLLGSPASAAERGAPFRSCVRPPSAARRPVRLRLPSGSRAVVPRRGVPGDPRRRCRAALDATTAWAPSVGTVATSSAFATTRSPTRRTLPRSGPGRRTTRWRAPAPTRRALSRRVVHPVTTQLRESRADGCSSKARWALRPIPGSWRSTSPSSLDPPARARKSSDFPATSPRVATALSSCRDSPIDSYIRGLTSPRQAVGHPDEPSGRPAPVAALRRRVRRVDLLHGRSHLGRQHPGKPGMSFAIWGR